jgi:hypothetical protein
VFPDKIGNGPNSFLNLVHAKGRDALPNGVGFTCCDSTVYKDHVNPIHRGLHLFLLKYFVFSHMVIYSCSSESATPQADLPAGSRQSKPLTKPFHARGLIPGQSARA